MVGVTLLFLFILNYNCYNSYKYIVFEYILGGGKKEWR
jgi:hypothetical protein